MVAFCNAPFHQIQDPRRPANPSPIDQKNSGFRSGWGFKTPWPDKKRLVFSVSFINGREHISFHVCLDEGIL